MMMEPVINPTEKSIQPRTWTIQLTLNTSHSVVPSIFRLAELILSKKINSKINIEYNQKKHGPILATPLWWYKVAGGWRGVNPEG